MVPLEDRFWLSALDCLDFALQPIVNIYSGDCYGYEALLRGVEGAGFASIQQFLDAAAETGVLHQVDLRLREIAIHKFAAIANGRSKLFFNLDNRLLCSRDYTPGETVRILSRYGLTQERVCFLSRKSPRIPRSGFSFPASSTSPISSAARSSPKGWRPRKNIPPAGTSAAI